MKEVISAAKNNNCSIRIGVNAGSLEKDILEKYKEPCPEALVESALRNIKILEDQNFFNFKISVKSSDVFLSIGAYKQLSKVCDYPLHLGITEAGSFVPGSIRSSIGLGTLLMDGVGDTIRVSLSDEPIQEVKIGNEILKSLNLRHRGVKIISCPSCARQAFQVIDTVKALEEKLSHIKTPITLSIIGCVVNGPGEAALTDIGITGGGKGSNMLYIKGIQKEKLGNAEIISKVVSIVEKTAEDVAQEKPHSWFYKQAEGGGSLLDYLGYGTTLGTWFLGGRSPLEVTATVDEPTGLEVDEHSVVVARYNTGLSKFETRWGTFTDPWTHQPQPKCGFVVVGSEGTISS